MSSPRTVAFHTLGCKLNFSESSTLARSLEEAGYARIKMEERPDVFVLNTCSVTENADKECRQWVRKFQRINPEAFVAVVGCYAQLKPDEIASIPGVDLVLGANEKFDLATHIEACYSGLDPESQNVDAEELGRLRVKPGVSSSEKAGVPTPGGVVRAGAIKEVRSFIPSYSANDRTVPSAGRTRTFLKVQDGCDYFCSFCTIPLARGRSRSGTIGETVAIAERIAATGVKEIVLTGVNTGDFGRQHGQDFLLLIQALDEVQGIERFRISSIEPNLCHDGIIDFVARSRRFAPHFHMPLQSGSDVILQRMRRRYYTALYAERVERIKQRMPHACIGVDVITGTPGETDTEFLKTYEFLRTIPVDYLHVFTYSERANTTAVRMDDAVRMEVRRERTKQLRILGSKLQRAHYERHLGTTRAVLFEQGERSEIGISSSDHLRAPTSAGPIPIGPLAEDPAISVLRTAGSPPSSGDPAEVLMEGYTDNYIRVSLPYDTALVNTITPVELQRMNGDGHVLGEVQAFQFSDHQIF